MTATPSADTLRKALLAHNGSRQNTTKTLGVSPRKLQKWMQHWKERHYKFPPPPPCGGDNRDVYIPTQDEITLACLLLQATWTDEQEASRRGVRFRELMPNVIPENASFSPLAGRKRA